ncbi:hypothetical protein ACN28C_19100 [Plantactinospora sp. WMMC1484]|uniref:hypothetical protein n=1 Tax=Plantactinospora sp. WMMC1484 TaxID=3404122 RepID=UPI003BF5ECB7
MDKALRSPDDPQDMYAFFFFFFFFLAVVRAMTHHLGMVIARSVHGTSHCVDSPRTTNRWLHLCAHCADVRDEHIRRQFDRLRRNASNRSTDGGNTGIGGPSRIEEINKVVSFLYGPHASIIDPDAAGADLLRYAHHPDRANADIAPWLRAIYWQFVHQDQRRAIAELRRRSATARGMHARPERDLTTARWAAPLAEDPIGLDLLISFVIGLRDQVSDPWRIPHAAATHGLSNQQVRLRLTAALSRLRRINPSFYDANVAAPLHRRADRLDPCDDLPGARPIRGSAPDDPAEQYTDPGDTPQRRRRRQVLLRLLANPAVRRSGLPKLLAEMCAVALDRCVTDLDKSCARRLRLPADAARRRLELLAVLVAGAGVEWLDDLLSKPPG